jgi:hypothetical protein
MKRGRNPQTAIPPHPTATSTHEPRSQNLKTLNDQNRFGILVIVICLIFVICDLDFPSLHHSITPTRLIPVGAAFQPR